VVEQRYRAVLDVLDGVSVTGGAPYGTLSAEPMRFSIPDPRGSGLRAPGRSE
jgi:hypothetical protein